MADVQGSRECTSWHADWKQNLLCMLSLLYHCGAAEVIRKEPNG